MRPAISIRAIPFRRENYNDLRRLMNGRLLPEGVKLASDQWRCVRSKVLLKDALDLGRKLVGGHVVGDLDRAFEGKHDSHPPIAEIQRLVLVLQSGIGVTI